MTTPVPTPDPLNVPFEDLCWKIRTARKNQDKQPKWLVCFDPGETTGFASFQNFEVYGANQLDTKDLAQGLARVNDIFAGIVKQAPVEDVLVVIEDYRIYSWKTDQHTWAGLHTPKLIGGLVALCGVHGLRFHFQMAYQAKQFVTDEKLEAWGFWQPGWRHARDAIRHGCYYRMFGQEVLDPLTGPKHPKK